MPEPSARLPSLDILRGLAILGIFAMNIRNYALPIRDFDNPGFPTPPATTADLWTWGLSNLIFEDKMIAILSMLFGAGIVLAAGRSARPALTHYRRMFWLFVIGLIHAYGLWYGDILNTYAICGAVLYLCRRLRPALVIGLGIVVLTIAIWFRVGPGIAETLWPSSGGAAESTGDRIIQQAIQNESAAYHGSWLDLFKWRAHLNTFWHFYGCIDFNFYRCGGFMLVGMGLVDVLAARRSSAFYWSLLIAGYAAGLALFAPGFWPQFARALGRAPALAPEARRFLGPIAFTLRYTGSACIAIGHVGLVMLLARAVPRLLSPLAAAGRLALSNYLLQTLIAITIFDGWAGAQWGTWRTWQLYTLVAAVWLAQLILSPIYLRFFRLGPAEWLWRTLTYWRPQPFRVLSAPAGSA